MRGQKVELEIEKVDREIGIAGTFYPPEKLALVSMHLANRLRPENRLETKGE